MNAEVDIKNLKKFISIFGSEPVFVDRSSLIFSDDFPDSTLTDNENFSITFRPLIVKMECVRSGNVVMPSGRFFIINGEHRLPMAEIYDSVPVIILDNSLSDSVVEAIRFLMSIDISDMEDGDILEVVRFGYEFLINFLLPRSLKDGTWKRVPDIDDRNFNRRIIGLLSELINMSSQNLYRYISLSRSMAEPFLPLLKSGVLSLRSAYLLSREPNDVQLCVYDFICKYKIIIVTEADALILCRLTKENIKMSDEQKIKELEEQNALLETELKNVKNQLAQARSKSKIYREEILNAIDDDMRSGAGSYSKIPHLSTLLAIEDKFKSINSLSSSLMKTIYKATSVGYDFHNRELENLLLLINKFVGVYNAITSGEPLAVVSESDVKESALSKKNKKGGRNV